MAQINKSSFDFLNQLTENNNRDWFNENKPWYQDEHLNATDFAEAMLQGLKEHDDITTVSGKKSMMRVYRDVRFSKDKSPYNPRWAGSFSRQKPHLRGGYYFHLKPGQTVIGGGFYGPVPEDLKLIRDQIAQDDQPLRSVLNDPAFKKVFGALQGEQVKTAPKGFDKEHPAIDLLRHKSMYVFRDFSDKEVLSPNFLKEALSTFVALRPFFDVMTEYLTTDLNGLSRID
ncbi:DUF2461 domain-containing protein [Roseivirga sp. E12]|uniref:DUF2461 domain-containing protein n=1 Tax=Roseivirga sp. E12 TaxID=2819237 RepID=UPI001ABD3735|nr:DUF2461 domain-containing protein [Roseivirga sp. E12]MBO3700584.1 DUF2461 domain-containing protein [Roseivirga sp. E12]